MRKIHWGDRQGLLRIVLVALLGGGCAVVLKWKYNHEYYNFTYSHQGRYEPEDVGFGFTALFMVPIALWFGGINGIVDRLSQRTIRSGSTQSTRLARLAAAVLYWSLVLCLAIYLLHHRLPGVNPPPEPTLLGVMAWYAAVSAGIMSLAWGSWRHYVAFGFIAAAVAIFYLDNSVLPANSKELDDFDGLQPTWLLDTSGTLVLRRIEMKVLLLDQHEVEGRIYFDGSTTKPGTLTINFPEGTVIAESGLGDSPGDTIYRRSVEAGPFQEEVLFWWSGNISKTMGIGKSLYKFGIYASAPTYNSNSTVGPEYLPATRLLVQLPDGSQRFDELFPAPTSAPKYQTAVWDNPQYSDYIVQAMTTSLIRGLAEQAISILLVGFGFFLGSLDVPKRRQRLGERDGPVPQS